MNETEKRKTEHITICLNEQVEAQGIRSGFEQYRFRHNALPEINFEEIDLGTSFLGANLRTPLLMSSMTGGSQLAGVINERLAKAAQRRGWSLGIGSVRAAVEKRDLSPTFQVRSFAPDIPIIANIGAVQLNYGFGIEDCMTAVNITEADMLVLHLNSMQEVFQPEGDTAFSGLLKKIEELCVALPIPIGVKEVGWGIDAETARKLYHAGIAFIDVAGAGGTSWSQVEKFRGSDVVRTAAAEAFTDWGIPTANCIREVRAALPQVALIGSGGVRSGVDAAKAIALGADVVGIGRSLLTSAVESEEALDAVLQRIELELRIAMFGIGAGEISDLRHTTRLVRLE